MNVVKPQSDMGEAPGAGQGGKHSRLHICAIVLTAVMFVITIIFNYMSSAPVEGLFVNQTGAISDAFPSDVTPAGWAFSVWGIIYTYLGATMVYAISTLFRRHSGPGSDFLYCSPYGIPILVFPILIFNLALNISWLFLWDRQFFWPALFFILLLPITLYVILFLCLRRFPDTAAFFLAKKCCPHIADMYLQICIVHNAFAVYAGWVSIAWLLNLSICFTYGGPGMAVEDAGTMVLVLLLIELLAFLPLELVVFETRFRGIFAHYIPLFMGLIASLTKNYRPGGRNSILTIVLLVLVGLAYLAKLAILIYKTCIRRDACQASECGERRDEEQADKK